MDTQKARVLVADDDESIRQLLCTIIRREQYEVDCVRNGIEAIEHLERNEYAVILLDLMMPRLDGFGVIEYLKNYPRPAKPIVLVITAYTDQKFKQVDSGIVAGVLRKPFEIAEVGSLIRLCVNGFDSELSQKLYVSEDKAIRHFVRDKISDRGHQNN